MVHLDGSIGPQRSSLRPSSARFSFGRSARDQGSKEETPGPGEYDDDEFFITPDKTSAIFAVDAQRGLHLKPYPYPWINDDLDADPIPDSAALRYNAPPRLKFGSGARDGKATDFETLRACPQHGYGGASPGIAYYPDDKRTRPRSAPSYTIRSRKADTSRHNTPSDVAPNSYPGAATKSMGVQSNSKHRTARASSFSRSERFPKPKAANGSLTEECKTVQSSFGDQRVGKRGSGYNACFGSASRETAQAAAHRPGSATLRMPHPPVAPRKELIRFGSNLERVT